jgi:hypothetical protein
MTAAGICIGRLQYWKNATSVRHDAIMRDSEGVSEGWLATAMTKAWNAPLVCIQGSMPTE